MKKQDKKRQELIIPSLKVGIADPKVYHMVKSIVEAKKYPAVFYLLMHKLSKEPNIIQQSESTTDIKMTKTIDSLESITKILEGMTGDQDHLKGQLTESIKIMGKLTDEFEKMREQNKVQQSTLEETLTILSASSEGLEMLDELKKKTQFSLTEIVNASKTSASSYEEIKNEVNTFRGDSPVFAGEKDTSLIFGDTMSASAMGYYLEDDLDGEDLLGSDLSDEQMLDIVSSFKSE